MGLESEQLVVILRELVQFLESLCEIKLPTSIESVRENLLPKSKAALAAYASRTSSCSPEPYLNMNAGRGTLIVSSDNFDDVQEYVKADKDENTHDYYETFQEASSDSKKDQSPKTDDDSISNFIEIYSHFSVDQTRSQCRKCGPLQKKEKFFLFEPLKSYFVGLVGTHLLIYSSNKDSRPISVVSLQGYQSRHARNIVPKHHKRGDAAFEIFRPGYETLQFVAKSAEEMQEWISCITEMINYENEKQREKPIINVKSEEKSDSAKESVAAEAVIIEERYQDVGPINNVENNKDISKSIKEASRASLNSEKEQTKSEARISNADCDAPPLPKRMTRKLPEVPVEPPKSTYEEWHDEDNIYYKIEDINKERYQNFMVGKRSLHEQQNRNYDDVETSTPANKVMAKNLKSVVTEMYDDIIPYHADKEENGVASYDEIKATQDKKDTSKKNKPKTKIVQYKRSFLDKMRRRKSTLVQDNIEALSVSNSKENLCDEVERPEDWYVIPPPPRPVLELSCPVKSYKHEEQLYDDIDNCKQSIKIEEERLNNSGVGESLVSENTHVNSQDTKSIEAEQLEHYQVPKTDRPVLQEDLYDDIALLTDFKNRQRRQSTASLTDKMWSRFGNGKMKIFEFSGTSDITTKLDSPEPEEPQPVDVQSTNKVTTFQRILSKVENSLGKSPKSTVKVQSRDHLNGGVT